MPCGGNNWPKIIYMFDREVVSNGTRGRGGVTGTCSHNRIPFSLPTALCIISTFHIGWIKAEEKEREIQTSVCSVY